MASRVRDSKGAAGWLVLLIILIAAAAAVFAFDLDELAKYHYYRLTYKVTDDPAAKDFSGCYQKAQGPICVSMDIRMFTFYAFLEGVAGYDRELGKTKTSERLQLESDMGAKLATVASSRVERWRKYYEDNDYGINAYVHYVLALGRPPEFEYIEPRENINDPDFFKLGGFRDILSDFFVSADIQSLYEWHRNAGFFRLADLYDLARIAEQQKFANRYMKLDNSKMTNMSLKIIPVPYESHEAGYAAVYGNVAYLVDGPGQYDTNLDFNLYIHAIIDPTVKNTIWAYQTKFGNVFRENAAKPYVNGHFERLDTYVAENIARVMEHRIQLQYAPSWAKYNLERKLLETEKDEILNGFVLIPYFAEKLDEFEQEGTIEVTTMIKRALAAY